ncbi:Hsp70 family protein [Candidatus Sneabacter namystus]|uniref:Hsp70 family protein n=1 Tax=Candidatus Sneabacter namystus TaxID=2601646 RepID=A0A5C0UJ69_9RICK|nr:Hsp70 family protein [Candidatus Sneabacter namystus]QEK39800.1 Hsp70 family protein [Candidatus Sneabacter namystus]
MKDDIAIGIDFGTTNTVVVCIDEEKVRILLNMPSEVSVDENGSVILGKDKGVINVSSIKRLLSGDIKDSESLSDAIKAFFPNLVLVKGECFIKVGEKLLSPVLLVSKILEYVRLEVENILQKKISFAILTAPAYFNNNAKSALLKAAKLAGIKVLRIISEPTAAAYAYKVDNKDMSTYLVFDLGGGTFDVSLLQSRKGILRVLGVKGDAWLGGDDADFIIADSIRAKLSDLQVHKDVNILLLARQIKEALSSMSCYRTFVMTADNVSVEISFTISELEHLLLSITNKTIALTKSLLSEHASVKLDKILLVGGSVQLPVFDKALREAFPSVIIEKSKDTEKIVGIGAALQAYNLSGNRKDVLIDVVPLSLGIEVADGLVEVIIPRNSPIPSNVTKLFTTQLAGQTSIKFNVLQGEREFAKDCISIATFELDGIVSMPAGVPRVEVTFALDMNGVLSVQSTELLTNISQDVIVHTSCDLSQDVVHDMISDSISYMQKDSLLREVVESRRNAEILIKKIGLALSKTKTEYPDITGIVSRLRTALDSNDEQLVIDLTQQLNIASINLFSEVLQTCIKGKEITSIM